MKAAVVHHLGSIPVYGDYPEPHESEGYVVVDVLAAPLSPIVKSLVAGTHYSDKAEAGFVPGIDGVGKDSSGRRVYFLFPQTPFGSMAQKSLVSLDTIVPVPDGVSDERAASVVTAGLSSWVSLTRRAAFQRGETVFINGATGSAGRLAVQIAKYLGASKIIASGRSRAKLEMLPDGVEKIVLDDYADVALRRVFANKVDVVLDYLGGEPASRVIAAATFGRGSRLGESRIRYIQLGSIAGEDILVAASSLRSSGLELLGSGIGSVSISELVSGAGQLLAALPVAGFEAPVMVLPLADVAGSWSDESEDQRIVFRP